MFLSILIPTYDYVCYTLVNDLHKQCEVLDDLDKYEIIVMEDGGKDQVKSIANLKINDLPNCRYIRKKDNVGRAYNINNLVKEAKGDWCIIMDCDAQVISSNFIKNYISATKQHPNGDVIIGGLTNPDTLPSPEVSLRYTYEKDAEPYRTIQYCNAHPYSRFCTFNVMIKRSLILATPFHPTFTQYGFEDIFMGVELSRKKVNIVYIENPLQHTGFDDNNIFLKKTETALTMLHKAGDMLLPYTKLGKVVDKCHRWHMENPLYLCYKITKPLLRKNLLGRTPNMKLFALYKLGYYIELTK